MRSRPMFPTQPHSFSPPLQVAQGATISPIGSLLLTEVSHNKDKATDSCRFGEQIPAGFATEAEWHVKNKNKGISNIHKEIIVPICPEDVRLKTKDINNSE